MYCTVCYSHVTFQGNRNFFFPVHECDITERLSSAVFSNIFNETILPVHLLEAANWSTGCKVSQFALNKAIDVVKQWTVYSIKMDDASPKDTGGAILHF